MVVFFALNPYCQELVIWHHLHGYLLFLVLLLGSLVCLLRHVARVNGEPARSRWLWAAWGLALLSAFAYELGQVYAVLAGLFLAVVAYSKKTGGSPPITGRSGALRLFAAFAAIALVYQAANSIDRGLHEGHFDPNDSDRRLMRQRAFEPQTATNAARFGVYTAVQPFFPSAFRWTYSFERLLVAEAVWVGVGTRTLAPTQVTSYGVIGLAAVLALTGLWAARRRGAECPCWFFFWSRGSTPPTEPRLSLDG